MRVLGHFEVNFQEFPTRFAHTDRIKTQVQLAQKVQCCEISITPVVAWLRGLEQYVSFALQRSRRPIPALYLPEIPQQHRK